MAMHKDCEALIAKLMQLAVHDRDKARDFATRALRLVEMRYPEHANAFALALGAAVY